MLFDYLYETKLQQKHYDKKKKIYIYIVYVSRSNGLVVSIYLHKKNFKYLKTNQLQRYKYNVFLAKYIVQNRLKKG